MCEVDFAEENIDDLKDISYTTRSGTPRIFSMKEIRSFGITLESLESYTGEIRMFNVGLHNHYIIKKNNEKYHMRKMKCDTICNWAIHPGWAYEEVDEIILKLLRNPDIKVVRARIKRITYPPNVSFYLLMTLKIHEIPTTIEIDIKTKEFRRFDQRGDMVKIHHTAPEFADVEKMIDLPSEMRDIIRLYFEDEFINRFLNIVRV